MMKKSVCILLTLLCILTFASCEKENRNTRYDPVVFGTVEPETGADTTPGPTEVPVVRVDYEGTFSGKALCVIDIETKEIYCGINENTETLMASITKLMTALTAYDFVDTEKTVTVKAEWLELLKSDSTIECYGFKAGSRTTVNDLFSLMLVKSYGDAAEALRGYTEEISGRSFIELMNEKAASLGMTGTVFDNSIGLDVGNNFTKCHTTAYDTALLVAAAMSNGYIAGKCSGEPIVLTDGKYLTSTNSLLKNGAKSDTVSLMGGKTGATNAAKYTFGAVFQDKSTGKKYAMAYLNGTNWNTINKEMVEIMEFIVKSQA